MKALFSLFLAPAVGTTVITALCSMLIYLYGEGVRPSTPFHNFWTHLYFCILHLSMVVGLGLGLLTFFYSACLSLFGFIVKARLGAFIALGMTVFCFLMVNYLLQTTI